MADLIIGLVADTVKTLSSLAVAEILELRHVREGLDKLKDTVPNIEELLDRLEENNHPQYWLEQVEAARYDLANLISSWEADCHLWETKSQVRKLVTFNLSSKHRASVELKRIEETLSMLITREGIQNNRVVAASSDHPDRTRETGSQLPNVIVGRDDEKTRMIDLLKDETSNGGNFSIVPIVGSGGVGKTFLAQLLFNHFFESHFDCRSWVWVTDKFDINHIFSTIVKNNIKEEARKYGNCIPDYSSLNSATRDDLIGRVKDILTGKKFLIVLDDLWHYTFADMNSLVEVLCVGGKGSKVLVTSRSVEVSNLKYSKSPNLLNYLDNDQSWSLFEQFAFKADADRDPKLEELGRQIVRRCGGLPLALKLMGNLLCGTELRRWSKIAESPVWDVPNVEVLPALRLSYNSLPSRLHKKCFAYCAVFQKGHLFEKDELVKLWMAEGFVQHEQGQRTEDTGADYFDDLSQRTLLECSNLEEGKYKMHDLVHDLAQTVSKPFCCRVIDSKETSSLNEKTRHVSLFAEQVEQPTLDIINKSKLVHTLLFPVPRRPAHATSHILLPFEDLRRFGKAERLVFQSLVNMHVLDMSSSSLQTLPDSIGELKLLRYLDVSKTEIKELPDSICNLYHLQTLKLLSCPFIVLLPKKFQLLVQLRHLELDGMFWFKLSAIPQNIGRLIYLHNLHKFQVGCNTGYKLEELKDMKYLTGKLHITNLENAVTAEKKKKKSAGEENLAQIHAKEANLSQKKKIDKLVYEWSDSEINLQEDAMEMKVLEDLKPPAGITELRICHYRGSKFPSWMENGELQELVTIVLNDCNKVKTLSLGQLPNLKEVHLKNMHELEEWNVEEYESLDVKRINEKKYQPLSRMTICNCPRLVKLPSCFSKLDHLKIIKCEKLENIPFGPMRFITLEDNVVMKDWGEESLQVILEEEDIILDGDIEDIPTEEEEVIPDRGSEGIPTGVEVILDGDNQDIPSDVEDVILDGENQDIPTENYVTQHLEALKLYVKLKFSSQLINLKIVRCPALIAFRGLFAPQKLEISDCSSLSALPAEDYAQRLILLALDSCQGDALLGNIPRSPELLNLRITNINDVSCLPTFPELPKLETLHIHDCSDLEYLSTPENRLFERFTCLETLSIKNCPKLVTLPAEGLPTSLRYMNIGPCESLTSFGPPDVLFKLNSLHDLYIEGCPALQSLPNDGFSSSLLHLSIKGCPLLMKNCAKDGSDWQKIKDISDLEIETPSSSSRPWYKLFNYCRAGPSKRRRL